LLISRESPEDRRNIALSINDAGTRLVKKVNRRTAIARVLGEMAADDRDLLATTITDVVT
jgi:DNA-binding MarR family transcriptional regulator